jgi:ubiquinone/menaquinone biosynthesis C-methylase UbiE
METAQDIKNMVREKYSEIALQSKEVNSSSCCGATCGCGDVSNLMADEYQDLKGYNPDADLGLGCGLPTEFAKIKKGDTVIDLGSGAGNDCFVARAETGETGKVIGIDMTEAMINRARINAEKLGYHNIEFRLGEIENMPVTSNSADVIISNCVLNLVPDKKKAFQEILRILKPRGHFSISDIVLQGALTEKIKQTAEMYAGCISGAIQKADYLRIIQELGFTNVTVQKEKAISVPDEILSNYLTAEEMEQYKKSGLGIYSVTVYAEKKQEECCNKDTCCK